MTERKIAYQPMRIFLPATVVLTVVGLGGVAWVTNMTTPDGGTRWLFYFTAMLGLTGLGLPVMVFLNRRFPTEPPPSPGVVLRQAIWPALYIVTLLRFSAAGVRSMPLVLLMLAGIILIEWLLRMTERSQWRPGRSTSAPPPSTAGKE